MKSRRTQIIEAIAADMQKIRRGDKIPNTAPASAATFNTTVATVNRALREMGPENFPAIFLTDPIVEYRHILQDVRLAKMRIFVSGGLNIFNPAGELMLNNESVSKLDGLQDDVQAVLMCNPRWNKLARRSRVLSSDATTEIEEPAAAFSIQYEVDFIDLMDIELERFPLVPRPIDEPYAANPKYTQQSNIGAAIFNSLLTVPEVAWVEEADVWPVPHEQILRRQCPGFWFQSLDEQFRYTASQQVDKLLSLSLVHVMVDDNEETYQESVDRAASNVKNVIGRYADLEGRVLTWDVTSIRTNRSEFPVIFVDADTTIRYMQSFLES